MLTSLIIHWPYLLTALAMLLFPRQWLRLGPALFRQRRRAQSAVEKFSSAGPDGDSEHKKMNFTREMRNKRNYFDLFRAAAGGVALMEFSLEATSRGADAKILTLQMVVLLLATLIQTVRFDGKLGLFAPIFFYAGMSMALAGPIPSLFALVFMIAINPALPNPRVFISGFAVALIPLGYLLDSSIPRLVVNVPLLLLPPVLSLLTKRPMVIYAKRAKTT